MFRDSKKDHALYQMLVNLMPELSDTLPGEEESFYRLDKSGKITTMKAQNFQKTGISSFLNIDKSLFAQSTANFLNEKWGKPDTRINQIKRSVVEKLIYPVKPIARILFGTYFDDALHLIDKGDIKIELSSDHKQDLKFGIIINHEKEQAKLIYKKQIIEQEHKSPNVKYLKTHNTNLILYLIDTKIYEFDTLNRLLYDKL